MIDVSEIIQFCRIAGWNQKAMPLFANALHIGDQLLSVNGHVIDSAQLVYRLIKQANDAEKLTFVVKRIPAAKVYLFKRERDSQPLGLKRKDGTAEVGIVCPRSWFIWKRCSELIYGKREFHIKYNLHVNVMYASL